MAEETSAPSSTDVATSSAADKTSLTSEVKENQDKGQEVKESTSTVEQTGDKPAEKPAAEQPVVPEKYDLKLPKDVLVDETMMAKFTKFGQESKWTNDQAQKVADMHIEAIGAFVNKMDESFVQTVDSWSKELIEDKDFGGKNIDTNIAQARKVMSSAFLSSIPGVKADRLKADLEKTGMTTHPDVVRLLHYFGQFIGEDNKFIRGGTTAVQEQDAATIMYGSDGVSGRTKST